MAAANLGVIETLSLNGAGGLPVILLRFIGGSDGISAALPLAWSDLLLLSPCPLLAATVALAAARIAAMRTLADGREGI